MKLSEAIRLGAMSTKQAFNAYTREDGDGNIVATCALSAAGYAVGKFVATDEDFPVCRYITSPPADTLFSSSLDYVSGIIVNLNDLQLWSRERIADWVETVEQKFDAEQAAEPTCALTTV